MEVLLVSAGSLGAGYLLGWATRKIVGVLETVVALYVGVTAVLVYTGVVTVNFAALVSLLGRLTELYRELEPALAGVMAAGTTLVPFAAGFAIGFFRSPSAQSGVLESVYLE